MFQPASKKDLNFVQNNENLEEIPSPCNTKGRLSLNGEKS
jgi:hypothetical protein